MAGGLRLLVLGFQIVLGDPTRASRDIHADTEGAQLGETKSIYCQIVVIPIAMTRLLGPGAIANPILYPSEAKRIQSESLSLGLIGITVSVAVLPVVIFLSGRPLRRPLGDVGLGIVTRILRLLVASTGMHFLVTASTNVIASTVVPKVLRLH